MMGGDLSSVAQDARGVCCMCGRTTELFELPGRTEKLCLACSADFATVAVLQTEIDAATLGGQDTGALATEFEQFSRRILTRAQSADALGSW
jgi:hypothetical protein